MSGVLPPSRALGSGSSGRRRSLRTPALLGAAGLLAAGLTACTGGDTTGPLAASSKQPAVAKPSEARISVTPAAETTAVAPSERVVVTADKGTLTDVEVTDVKGRVLRGSLASDGTVWRSRGTLPYARRFTVSATAVDQDGRATSTTSGFTTVVPKALVSARMAPLDGETVGVGMPVMVFFTEPVQNRAAVERQLTVTTSTPVVGGWRWYGDREVHYRPRTYWPAGTRVTVDVGLLGVDAGAGTWGAKSRRIGFRVGAAQLSYVDARRHTMVVRRNGKVVRVMKVSTGRDKYPTSSGIHVVSDKERTKMMDSSTVGIPRNSPDGYYEKVEFNVRIANSGEFVHSAPWSVGSQGRRNVSHGCVNASPTDAQWFFGFARRGDVVQVVGTAKALHDGNGIADWTVPWSLWRQGSALA